MKCNYFDNVTLRNPPPAPSRSGRGERDFWRLIAAQGAAINLQTSRFPISSWDDARGMGNVRLSNYSGMSLPGSCPPFLGPDRKNLRAGIEGDCFTRKASFAMTGGWGGDCFSPGRPRNDRGGDAIRCPVSAVRIARRLSLRTPAGWAEGVWQSPGWRACLKYYWSTPALRALEGGPHKAGE